MSTKDQPLYSALHGTAMRYAAERRSLDESIQELREIADGRWPKPLALLPGLGTPGRPPTSAMS
jgi:hypothetical protein